MSTATTPSPGTGPAERGAPDGAPGGGRHAAPTAPDAGAGAGAAGLDRAAVVERQRARFGGVKVGSAFFGWLTATGTAVLLTALVAAAGAVVTLSSPAAAEAVDRASDDAGTIGLAGGVALLVVLFLAYLCGGYVAGRMARFDGARQGVAVWLWAVLIAVVVAVVGALAGDRYDVLGQLNSFPRIPVDAGSLPAGAVLALVATAVVSLVGAVLGGLLGMRFHRRVDRAGLGR